MKKEEILKILNFKSCCICNHVFTQGGSLKCIDHKDKGGLEEITYDFCKNHTPTFNCDIAIGSFGTFYRNGLKCFNWILGSTETASYWSEVKQEKIEEWLEKIYSK